MVGCCGRLRASLLGCSCASTSENLFRSLKAATDTLYFLDIEHREHWDMTAMFTRALRRGRGAMCAQPRRLAQRYPGRRPVTDSRALGARHEAQSITYVLG